MPNIGLKDHNCILNILEAIQKIKLYSSKFKNADEFNIDSLSFDATLMNFIVIGEMVEKISEDLKIETENTIDWPNIKNFRNIIAHNYFGVDAEEVFQIIKGSIPRLEKDLKNIIQ